MEAKRAANRFGEETGSQREIVVHWSVGYPRQSAGSLLAYKPSPGGEKHLETIELLLPFCELHVPSVNV